MTAATPISAALAAFVDKDYHARLNRIGYVSFHWYRATDAGGARVAFRFTKGAPLARFCEYVNEQGFQSVEGPYPTRKAALA